MIIALIGCHGAGKTTLGQALASRLGWTFHEEIGARLALDPRFRPDGVTAAHEQEAFDEAVMREELARDAAWDAREHRLVETWHPGNIAYSKARSPRLAARYLSRVLASTSRRTAAVIEVTAPPDVLAERRWEPGDLGFFLEVGAAARGVAERLGLPLIARVSTHDRSAEDLALDIAPLISMAARGGLSHEP